MFSFRPKKKTVGKTVSIHYFTVQRSYERNELEKAGAISTISTKQNNHPQGWLFCFKVETVRKPTVWLSGN